MKIAHITLSIVVVVFLVLLTGCAHGGETPSNTSAKPTPPPAASANAPDNSNHAAPVADSNRNANPATSSAAPETAKPKGPAGLVGTYESREVHNEGVVTVISQLRTIWLFSADGNYSRVSTVKGKTYHSDSGNFRLEAPDKLVLTIQVTGQKASRKIQSPPLIKVHKYTLSPDGEELRLISEKGSIGIFQRVAKPNAP